jgi:hypothetical protein
MALLSSGVSALEQIVVPDAARPARWIVSKA